MTTLSISHNIFLSRDQRYDLFNGVDQEVIGVSCPVWVSDGQTTEPAIEVFTKYRLMNKNDRIFIRQNQGYYEITIPTTEEMPKVPDEVWGTLTHEQKEHWYTNNEPNPSLTNLLDIKDGGCGDLAFRQYSKLEKDTGALGTLHVIHFVEIKDMSDLLDSLS